MYALLVWDHRKHMTDNRNGLGKGKSYMHKVPNDEPAYTTHCMSCGHGQSYTENDDIPESCPVCGEHKEYSILNINSLKGCFD